ncbi:deoxyribonuclease-1-like isoform X3 [Cottoperca gobio]|uniref:Deoxyribonuclease-1-like isoform X3 n=1 Tax=Cottoperca gobio TaxID=56716 RepID=A0A6J2PU49_COTGO|nr:deoxyribonuclease-1-like isoform X3 [Cottoperca gobio]
MIFVGKMKIAAFNFNRLGVTEVENEAVRNNLIKIVSRYSVVVILEVILEGKEEDGSSMEKFLTHLNNDAKNINHPYEMQCNGFLGPGKLKEKFVFFYRKDEVTLIDSFQYEKDGDRLHRPFVLYLECPKTALCVYSLRTKAVFRGLPEGLNMKIAAFNAKNLGWKKVTDKTVVHYLTKIMSQYSVVVILEVMDKSGKAMERLLKKLNNSSNSPYTMIASCRLGRDTYKERFVCFYREEDVTLEACHQYEDNQIGDVDAFAREPFILRFSCPSTVVKDLVLIPVHTKPTDSLKELDELHDVVTSIRQKWGTDNIIILGDFNADGRYLSQKKKKKIRISSAPYHWLIDDDVDTTSSNFNDHTYDRIVVYGQSMLNTIVPGSAKSFNFQTEFDLTDEETLSVSDHYPVEVELKEQKAQTPKRKRGPPSDTLAKRRELEQMTDQHDDA